MNAFVFDDGHARNIPVDAYALPVSRDRFTIMPKLPTDLLKFCRDPEAMPEPAGSGNAFEASLNCRQTVDAVVSSRRRIKDL